jgi:hypothetical protein
MVSQFASDLANVAISQHASSGFSTSTTLDLVARSSGSGMKRSAVFVSWCVKQAGATTDDFKFAGAHSVFIHDAINRPRALKGIDIKDDGPEIGDILQNNRGGTDHDFEFAKKHANYTSHSAIVVEVGQDTDGRYALTIGGNEGDAIRMKRAALKSNGRIRQKEINSYICRLKCQK